MWFVLSGLLLSVLKLLDVAPVSGWSWWLVLAPFALAALWWAWADKSGYTQKKVMQRMDAKKEARRERALEALGRGDKPQRRR